jgi:hypothetical protein
VTSPLSYRSCLLSQLMCFEDCISIGLRKERWHCGQQDLLRYLHIQLLYIHAYFPPVSFDNNDGVVISWSIQQRSH